MAPLDAFLMALQQHNYAIVSDLLLQLDSPTLQTQDALPHDQLAALVCLVMLGHCERDRIKQLLLKESIQDLFQHYGACVPALEHYLHIEYRQMVGLVNDLVAKVEHPTYGQVLGQLKNKVVTNSVSTYLTGFSRVHMAELMGLFSIDREGVVQMISQGILPFRIDCLQDSLVRTDPLSVYDRLPDKIHRAVQDRYARHLQQMLRIHSQPMM